MLVLSRKVGERIVIGDNVTLVVSRIVGNRVTLGIEAPNDVRVMRGELQPFAEAEESDDMLVGSAAGRNSGSMHAPLTIEFEAGALSGFMCRSGK